MKRWILALGALLGALPGAAAAAGADGTLAPSAMTPPDSGAKEYHTRFRNDAGDGLCAVEIEGRIRFSADESRIEWMGEGAYLLVVAADQGRQVRFRAEPDRHGRPACRYDVDGRTKRNAGDADRWLAGTLPVVFRELGHDADARVRTIHEQGGARAVLRTLATIRSDYSAGLHYVALFDRKDLTDQEIIDALSQLGADVETDQELATALYGAADLYREHPGVRTSFLACLEKIESGLVKSRITRDLFGIETISGPTPPTMIASAGGC